MKRLSLVLVAALCCLTAHAIDTNTVNVTRADFLKLVSRPFVPLTSKVEPIPNTNGLDTSHFSFASDADQRVPGLLYKSTNSTGQRPVVIVLHGTGGNKEGQIPLLTKLAANGFIAVAIDGRYHGERTKSGKGSAEYQEAIVNAWRKSGEHPLYYDTVHDVMRLIDYLKTRKDVDPQRIGLMGFSKGGIETYLAAAIDKRIAVAVPCIGVQSFDWALKNNAWQPRVNTFSNAFATITKDEKLEVPDASLVRKFYDRLIPGIYNEFDGPAMLPLIAPRPLLVINGDSDDRTPLRGLKECTDAAQLAYHEAKADERFLVRIQLDTGHKVTPDSEHAAIDWFIKWLKP